MENGGGSAAGLARANRASLCDVRGCASCLVFVVDATERDEESVRVARDMLANITGGRQGRGKPVVVVAAKSDVRGAMSETEVFDALELRGFGGGRTVKVVAASAMPGAERGLEELLEYLTAAAAAAAKR